MVEPRRVTPWVRLQVEAMGECLSRPNLTHSLTSIFVRASPLVTLQTHTAMLVYRALFVELCHEICCVVWVQLLLVVVMQAQALTINPSDIYLFIYLFFSYASNPPLLELSKNTSSFEGTKTQTPLESNHCRSSQKSQALSFCVHHPSSPKNTSTLRFWPLVKFTKNH